MAHTIFVVSEKVYRYTGKYERQFFKGEKINYADHISTKLNILHSNKFLSLSSDELQKINVTFKF